eukprot:14063620-Alexandrium_andersonii.AAC.1
MDRVDSCRICAIGCTEAFSALPCSEAVAEASKVQYFALAHKPDRHCSASGPGLRSALLVPGAHACGAP